MTQVDKVREVYDDVRKSNHNVITEESAKAILTEYGISVPPYALVKMPRKHRIGQNN